MKKFNQVSTFVAMTIMVALATATFAGCSKVANSQNAAKSTSPAFVVEVRKLPDGSSVVEESKVESQKEESKMESSVESQDESDFAVESSSLSSASEISQNVRASNDESSAEEKSEVESSIEEKSHEESNPESSVVEQSKVESSFEESSKEVSVETSNVESSEELETSLIIADFIEHDDSPRKMAGIGRLKHPIKIAYKDDPDTFYSYSKQVAIISYSDTTTVIAGRGNRDFIIDSSLISEIIPA